MLESGSVLWVHGTDGSCHAIRAILERRRITASGIDNTPASSMDSERDAIWHSVCVMVSRGWRRHACSATIRIMRKHMLGGRFPQKASGQVPDDQRRSRLAEEHLAEVTGSGLLPMLCGSVA